MNIDDLKDLDGETRKEIEELLKVTREKDGGKTYANAQFEIYTYIPINENYGILLEILSNIKKSDDEEYYDLAQMNIAVLQYYGEKNLDRASEILVKLLVKDTWVKLDASKYAFKIAKEYISRSEYEKSIQLFKLISSVYSYESNCYEKICKLILDSRTINLGNTFIELLDKTLLVVDILRLDFGQLSDEEKAPERKLAHYTGTATANLLLEIDEEKFLPSTFRLNTINNVNDPSEGHLLVNYLKDIRQNYFYAPDFDKNLHAFISCFTFNHDSLNQFRLYGKEADKEASGVSLVFKKEFFQLGNSSGGLSFLSLDNNIQNSNRSTSTSVINEQLNIRKNSDSKAKVGKQPVMRCVYIDPTSNYIQLAQRNRITFFREFSDETVRIKGLEISKAEHEWKKYKNYIEAKTKAFNDAFIDLKAIYKSIMRDKVKINKVNSELVNDIDVLTDEILLPLKYLIKHSAFQEEQECRMVYVTSIRAPEVKMVDKRFLFVEYEAEVKGNLNKVYIAPAATKYQLYLAWLLRDKEVKIDLSNNPYRQT